MHTVAFLVTNTKRNSRATTHTLSPLDPSTGVRAFEQINGRPETIAAVDEEGGAENSDGNEMLLDKKRSLDLSIPSWARVRAALTVGDWLRVVGIAVVGLVFLVIQFVPGLS